MKVEKDDLAENKLIEEITRHWKPSERRAGGLVQRFEGVWHYGVALSDTTALSWGPSKSLRLYYKGALVIYPLNAKFRDAVDVPYLSKDEIFENLIASVPAFHHKWKYGFQGWNCEHWARQVVSGQPISYQVKEQGFGIFDVFGVLHSRSEAIKQLNKYKLKDERP